VLIRVNSWLDLNWCLFWLAARSQQLVARSTQMQQPQRIAGDLMKDSYTPLP
jgi:hypothetical protein